MVIELEKSSSKPGSNTLCAPRSARSVAGGQRGHCVIIPVEEVIDAHELPALNELVEQVKVSSRVQSECHEAFQTPNGSSTAKQGCRPGAPHHLKGTLPGLPRLKPRLGSGPLCTGTAFAMRCVASWHCGFLLVMWQRCPDSLS